MNKYKCTLSGKSYSEATIKANLSKAYKERYLFEPNGSCEGCGVNSGQGSAHIIPKSILKQLHLTSLIWSPEMFFRACNLCNLKAENPESDDIKKLLNFETILEVTRKYCNERYQKMVS